MKIDCISDLHGEFPELEGGDMLIVAGDFLGHQSIAGLFYFNEWIDKQDYRFKVVIAGNHDTFMQDYYKPCDGLNFTYLQDSGCEFEGLRIWGSPWTAWFHGINPKCKAFTKHSDESLKKKWDLIPEDTDILVTHMPPLCMFDKIARNATHVGSYSLHSIVTSPLMKNLKLCVWGHIHEEGGQVGGQLMDGYKRHFVNASILNEDYEHVNKPVRIVL